MLPLFRRLPGVITTATRVQLRKQPQYLKLENQIVRNRITGPVLFTPGEKSLRAQLMDQHGGPVKPLCVEPIKEQPLVANARLARELLTL